jgi:hypothetical protein
MASIRRKSVTSAVRTWESTMLKRVVRASGIGVLKVAATLSMAALLHL